MRKYLVRNIKLTVAYDGTNLLGWQKTKVGRSVQEELEKVLCQITQHEISLQAASRTDAGVHALGQVVNFFLEKDTINLDELFLSMNQLLPQDISVLTCQEMPSSFHPTLDAIGKEYHYIVTQGKAEIPQKRLYSTYCPYKLDIKLMERAAKQLVGEHDFTSFCNSKKNEKETNFVRRLDQVELFCFDKEITIKMTGNRFLFRMARNIAGTLIDVGKKNILPEEIPTILKAKDRTKSGVTAPARGLHLISVKYI